MEKRAVIDTNVIVAALISAAGANRAVLRCCLSGHVVPLVGEALFQEYQDLLARPLLNRSPLSAIQREQLFNAFLSMARWVKVYYLWRPNLPDEADNHLIELALAGSAQFIVTNNLKDLSNGELRFPDLQILTPQLFLQKVSWQL